MSKKKIIRGIEGPRTFKPVVLETKEQLHRALKEGKIKSSKYNLLSDKEKLFVEMLVFGEYTASDAMKAIVPSTSSPKAMANRMLGNPNVAGAIEELSVQKDKKFLAELSSVRNMALDKLKYVMVTTDDDALAVACAKIALEQGQKVIVDTAAKDGPTEIKFKIEVDTLQNKPVFDYDPDDVIVVDAEPDRQEYDKKNSEALKEMIEAHGEDPSVKYVFDKEEYGIGYTEIDNYNDVDEQIVVDDDIEED